MIVLDSQSIMSYSLAFSIWQICSKYQNNSTLVSIFLSYFFMFVTCLLTGFVYIYKVPLRA